ncbi:MAG: GH116 family glycosyl-hydrolase, partial [Fimbriimonadaceae bacterium]
MTEPADFPLIKEYPEDRQRAISMPVGGIGTGCFGFSGRGRLIDWQIMGRPNIGWRPEFSHLLLALPGKGLRVLEGELDHELYGAHGAKDHLAGTPRFPGCRFKAGFPFGQCDLSDPDFPVKASVRAFSPLIPGYSEKSSLPFGTLEVTLENLAHTELEASVTFLLNNFVGFDGKEGNRANNVNEPLACKGWRGLLMSKAEATEGPRLGQMALLGTGGEVRATRVMPEKGGFMNAQVLGMMDQLYEQGWIEDGVPAEEPCPPAKKDGHDGAVTVSLSLPPGQTATAEFLVAWHFPWLPAESGAWSHTGPVKHYIGERFAGAAEVIEHVVPQLSDLKERTAAFVKGVADSPCSEAFKEAGLFNLAVLKSPTCFRTADGTFMAWEGCHQDAGCCHGSCTHVWNYEAATRSLFPDLHQSMLESHLFHGMQQSGGERFRLELPLAEQRREGAAADGQMGLILRTYSLWRIHRDNRDRYYRKARQLIEFCWQPNGWDSDQDGMMEGAKHNTYDVEFFGPNPMMGTWYLAALKAVANMAQEQSDDEFSDKCRRLFESGRKKISEELFNGEYFEQKVAPAEGEYAPMTVVHPQFLGPEPPYQVG